MADGFNYHRSTRVAELLVEFRTLQLWIAAIPTDAPHAGEYYTEGWAALRQCRLDGQKILGVAGDAVTTVARAGVAELEKAELQQVMLDAYSRRHEAQKIWYRQGAAQRWVTRRQQVLQRQRPNSGHTMALEACDEALRAEFAQITDDSIYTALRTKDQIAHSWIHEDPQLRAVQRWLRLRR